MSEDDRPADQNDPEEFAVIYQQETEKFKSLWRERSDQLLDIIGVNGDYTLTLMRVLQDKRLWWTADHGCNSCRQHFGHLPTCVMSDVERFVKDLQ